MLIVGLGNPGSEYKKHRHNIGFMAVDEIARAYGASAWTKKFGGEWAEGKMSSSRGLTTGSPEDVAPDPAIKPRDDKLFLLKPLTYMNLSGESVQKAASFFKLAPPQVIVLHDELDLPLGRLRVKFAGGHGGHNGLKSIDQHLGQDYWRVRVGIGHPGDKERVTGHVLGDFSKDEIAIKDRMIEVIARELPRLIAGDEAGFMNKVALEFKDSGAI